MSMTTRKAKGERRVICTLKTLSTISINVTVLDIKLIWGEKFWQEIFTRVAKWMANAKTWSVLQQCKSSVNNYIYQAIRTVNSFPGMCIQTLFHDTNYTAGLV